MFQAIVLSPLRWRKEGKSSFQIHHKKLNNVFSQKKNQFRVDKKYNFRYTLKNFFTICKHTAKLCFYQIAYCVASQAQILCLGKS